MKDDGTSFLYYIFQDPLLTIIALILLNTSWVVIPESSDYDDHKPMVTDSKEPSFQKDIQAIDDKISRLKIEIQHKQKNLTLRIKEIEELNAMLQEGGEDTNQINQKIQELQEELDKKQEELKQLEDALNKAKEELAGLPQVENIDELYTKIAELEREIVDRRSELSLLEEQIEIAKQRAVESKVQADAQNKLIEELRIKRDALYAEIAKLEAALGKSKPGGGFHAIKQTNKRAYYFEMENNLLFPGFWHGSNEEDEAIKENYNISKYPGYSILKRKPTVKGESINEIQRADSVFHSILNNKIDPSKEYIVFFVYEDSYEIFRKARELAEGKGVEVGWRPFIGEHVASGKAGNQVPPRE